MAVFAYENGKLVPAQPVDLSGSRLAEGALVALRERAVELLEAPLFPLAWVEEPAPSGSRESLITLDPSGQIVTVDVLARLSADELIAALAATGRHADNSSERLAQLYGPGPDAFAEDWRAFLDACPPSPRPGPRLFLIVLGIEEEVRPAVDALAGAGVDVRVASVIGSGQQVLISLEQVRPRITALSSLLGVARRRVSSRAQESESTWETRIVGTAEGDAAVEVVQAGGFGPGYIDVDEAPRAAGMPAEEAHEESVQVDRDDANEDPARSTAAPADVVDTGRGAAHQEAPAPDQPRRARGAHTATPRAAQSSPARETRDEGAGVPRRRGAHMANVELHDPASQPAAESPQASSAVVAEPMVGAGEPSRPPAPRHSADGLHAGRFGAPAASALPEALAGFEESEGVAPRRRRALLRDMLAEERAASAASEAREGEAIAGETATEAAADTAATPAPEAGEQTLSTFDISSRPPVAPRAQEPDVPSARAPESAVSVDSAISALTPSLPGARRAPRVPRHTAAEVHASRPARAARPARPEQYEGASAGESSPAYEESLAARRRAEQVLWDQSAPSKPARPAAYISESAAAFDSAEAVADAAERDYLSPAGRLMDIAQRNDTPLNVRWSVRRRGIELRAQIMPWGTIVLANGAAYSDPTQAAQEESGLEDVDGWRVWKADDGRSLGDL